MNHIYVESLPFSFNNIPNSNILVYSYPKN